MLGIFGDKQNVVGHNVFKSSTKTNEDDEDYDESHHYTLGLDTSNESDSDGTNNDNHVSAPLQEDDTNREDISDSGSTPRFVEIDSKESSGISSTQGHSQRKIKKNAGPQHNLPEKFVSNKPQLVMSVLKCRLDLKENKWLEQMKSKMFYQNAQDEKTGELKLLKIRENKAIKELEINYQHDIQAENNKYRCAQEEHAAELHRAQLKFQQEELELKKEVAKQNDRKIKESAQTPPQYVNLIGPTTAFHGTDWSPFDSPYPFTSHAKHKY
ncbi:hypothetical protein O181_066346 [Austropuccinia psidii MF-1]|uniref:Uncharacterized protein n=1 Tax=Austropuccinia psidii MF-1 TaxID=1389203 RepID=A0A9Q3I247_9BASI|nr:hypothetical protein [Austropuccinia psidii MF-1]